MWDKIFYMVPSSTASRWYDVTINNRGHNATTRACKKKKTWTRQYRACHAAHTHKAVKITTQFLRWWWCWYCAVAPFVRRDWWWSIIIRQACFIGRVTFPSALLNPAYHRSCPRTDRHPSKVFWPSLFVSIVSFWFLYFVLRIERESTLLVQLSVLVGMEANRVTGKSRRGARRYDLDTDRYDLVDRYG